MTRSSGMRVPRVPHPATRCQAVRLRGTGELRHARLPGGRDPLPAEHGDDGPGADLDVEADGSVVDVPGVQRQPLLPAQAVAAAYLREAGHAGPDQVAPELLRG